MAGQHGVATAASVTLGASAKTALTITAPSQQAVLVRNVTISGLGNSPTAGKIAIEVRQGPFANIGDNTGSNGNGTSLTLRAASGGNPNGTTFRSSARGPYSAEPTYTGTQVIIGTHYMHGQSNLTLGPFLLKADDVLIIRGTDSGGQAIAAQAHFEE